MSVLVKGMEKPEHCGYCRFRYDGICHALQKTQYSMDECPLAGIDDVVLNDTISRQAAIKEFDCCELTPDGGIDVNYAIDFLKQLPSVQQWIPCSERLPEEEKEVLISSDSGIYIAELEIYDGNAYWTETIEYRSVKNVYAWMPLPEPYKEESHG